MIRALVLLVAIGFSFPAFSRDIEATLLDGRVVQGRLTAVMPQITVETSSGRVELAWADVLSLRPSAHAASQASRPAASSDALAMGPADATPPFRWELTDGSVFAGWITESTERDLAVRLADNLIIIRKSESAAAVRFDLSVLASVASTRPGAEAAARLAEVMREPQTDNDAAVVTRGDKVVILRGALRSFGETEVAFTWNSRDVSLPWTRLAGLRLARRTPRSAFCKVQMTSGDVFAGRVREGDDHAVMLQSGTLDALRLPWSGIARIDCASDRLVFVSDLTPANYAFEPFFDTNWDYALDRTLTGKPIRLGGRTYLRGVTMHSRAALTYAIEGRYRQFAAVVGIVDEMENRGRVASRVVGDGRVLWEAPDVRGGEEPRPIVVDVTGVRELTLVVDFGEDLDLSDHACWAFARLIR